VRVKLKRHGADVLERFEREVKGCEQVVECYELLGETDCLLKLYLPNLEALVGVHARLSAQDSRDRRHPFRGGVA
jgi:DNA-binding Lrp family transcriptional regulator